MKQICSCQSNCRPQSAHNTFFEVITMKTDELIKALQKLKVQTGSLVCLGCGHEHNCGVHGCAIMREAAVRLSLYEHALEQVAKERDTLLAQLKRLGGCMDASVI